MTKTKSQKARAKGAEKALQPVKTAGKAKRKRNGKGGVPRGQTGAVVDTRFGRLGMSDVRKHLISWIAGYSFVGDGTNGATDSVLFQTATSTYLALGRTAGASGCVPIVGGDSQLGASYITDIIKHYARMVINRARIRVESLQPSTSNNMMMVIAPLRGPGATNDAYFIPLATASPGNTLTDVTSMKGSMTVDSYQTKTMDITDFVAGGSGPRQNEFEVSNTFNSIKSTIVTSGAVSGVNGIGLVPACFAIAGNNTTTGLRNTKVHQIVIELEVDLLDFLGGMISADPVG